MFSELINANHRLNRHGAVHQADAGVGGVAVYAEQIVPHLDWGNQ